MRTWIWVAGLVGCAGDGDKGTAPTGDSDTDTDTDSDTDSDTDADTDSDTDSDTDTDPHTGATGHTGLAEPDDDRDGVPVSLDCDDTRADVFPGAAEACDGVDQDCDGTADDGLPLLDTWTDADGDGHGDPASTPVPACGASPGASLLADDCADDDPDAYPTNPERCDQKDQDCDETVDEDLPTYTSYRDHDGDGFGAGPALQGCLSVVPGWVADGTDCDDGRSEAFPGAVEIGCNGLDEDCAGGDGGGDWLVPGDFATPVEAVAASAPGDTVCIAPGDYPGLLTVPHDLTLTATAPGVVVSTGDGTRVVDLVGGHVRLVGLTLDGRDTEPLITVGPGVVAELTDLEARDVACGPFGCRATVAEQDVGSALVVRRFRLDDPDVGTGGTLAPLFAPRGERFTLENTVLHGHTIVANGGAFLLSGGTAATLRDVTLSELQWTGATQEALLVGDVGGELHGLRLVDDVLASAGNVYLLRAFADVDLTGSDLSRNALTSTGGAAALLVDWSNSRLGGTRFVDNVLSATGGDAVVIDGVGNTELVNDTFAGNTATVVADLTGFTASVTNCVFAWDAAATAMVANPTRVTYTDVVGPATPLVDPAAGAVAWTGLAVDPDFVPYTTFPSGTSPLLDAGDPTIVDRDGSRSDLGATGGPLSAVPDI